MKIKQLMAREFTHSCPNSTRGAKESRITGAIEQNNAQNTVLTIIATGLFSWRCLM
ncbi:hypothetical protein D3C72_2568440 [compost metagenome]